MEFTAISPPKTLNFPPSFAGKIRTESITIPGRAYIRHERRQFLTNPSALSEDNKPNILMRACRDETDSEPLKFNHRREWLHFIGIGGCGISALAMLALKQGYQVSGSDLVRNSYTDRLQESGARLYIGHSESNIRRDKKDDNGSRFPNALIISSAIPQNNVEVLYAKSEGLPVYKRDHWLGKLTERHKLIAISGSHGKSTTASMISYVLKEMGDDLTAVVGAEIPQFKAGNVISGSSETFVIEADEYDNCFLKLSPHIAVVTNVEWEHVDIFRDVEAVKSVFRRFLSRIRKGGHLILCGDSEGAYSLLNLGERESKSDSSGCDALVPSSERCGYSYKIATFGVSSSNEWHASAISQNSDGGTDFTLCHRGSPVADFSIQIPGIYNVLNSLAVIATMVAMVGNERQFHDTVDSLRKHLKSFRGVSRRFEIIGSIYGCHIIDDYAHHPTEIRAVIQAARQRFPTKALLAVFQPHTYSRLAALKDDFAIALSGTDQVVITEVYASREVDNHKVCGNDLSAAIVGPPSEYISSLESVVDKLFLHIGNDPHRNIVVLTLGAGDITTVGPRLLNKLQLIFYKY